jgi:hypothetical protein
MPPTANTTIADHGYCRQKWPSSAPHETFRSAPTHRMDGRQPLEQADIIFGAVGVCIALKTLRFCGDASWPEAL